MPIMTPGYYMPNYGNTNPYYQPIPQQSYASAPQQQNVQAIQWVDGEVGAKAYRMPQGWPAGTPIPLWDSNDTVIYLKSMNQMGMPNPLQRIHYTMDEQQMLPSGQMSGSTEQKNQQNFATKDDLETMKKELLEQLQQANQNGSNNGQNGGTRR